MTTLMAIVHTHRRPFCEICHKLIIGHAVTGQRYGAADVARLLAGRDERIAQLEAQILCLKK